MTIYSDYEAADLALDLEERFDIDMNLEDMFSDDLNNYFNYEFNEVNNTVTFFFELDEGSCKLIVHKPFAIDESYTFNKTLRIKVLENLGLIKCVDHITKE